jgi:hypothetical protein
MAGILQLRVPINDRPHQAMEDAIGEDAKPLIDLYIPEHAACGDLMLQAGRLGHGEFHKLQVETAELRTDQCLCKAGIA